jgi:hypothetical protein
MLKFADTMHTEFESVQSSSAKQANSKERAHDNSVLKSQLAADADGACNLKLCSDNLLRGVALCGTDHFTTGSDQS